MRLSVRTRVRRAAVGAVVGAVGMAVVPTMPRSAASAVASGPHSAVEYALMGGLVAAGKGESGRSAPQPGFSGAFIYRNGSYAPLRAIPGAAPLNGPAGFPDATTYSFRVAINDRGQIAGAYSGSVPAPDGAVPPGSTHGFVQSQRGDITPFDIPGAAEVLVEGINDHGQIVGWYAEQGTTLNPDGSLPPHTVHGFVWDHGQFTRLEVPGAVGTFANGINNAGQIVGNYTDAHGNEHGFLLSKGTATTLDAPNRTYTAAFGINDRGEVLVPEGTLRSYQVATH